MHHWLACCEHSQDSRGQEEQREKRTKRTKVKTTGSKQQQQTQLKIAKTGIRKTNDEEDKKIHLRWHVL
jgi:hypothetical protein